MKKVLAFLLASVILFSLLPATAEEALLRISIYYPDNATLPFRDDWMALKTIEEKYNVDLVVEPLPISDFNTKVSLALSTGENAPDVIVGAGTQGQTASLALNGAAVAISDYSDWTPNLNARIAEFGLESQVELLRLGDGKLYYMPALWGYAAYDGGLIMRQDYLEAKGFEAPRTFDDFYEILKAYKSDYPDSYPMTNILNPGFIYNMTMPSWGISLGQYSSTGTNVLSWNYETKEYFPGAVSEEYKAYITFLSKLYREGLLDPEMTQDDTSTARKIATGKSMALYAFYDQMGGWTEASEIEGFKLNLYPVLEGPAGAHHKAQNRTGNGIMFPIGTSARDDFEQVVRKVDEIFFSEEAVAIWNIGVEGVTYTMDDGKIILSDDIVNSTDGAFKYMQNAYGCGTSFTRVWSPKYDLVKYDENYARINETVAAMQDAIQYIPATPDFDELTAEEAALMQTDLFDTWQVWNDAFLTGKKSIETDWDAYVQEMKDKGIERFCEIYNTYKK